MRLGDGELAQAVGVAAPVEHEAAEAHGDGAVEHLVGVTLGRAGDPVGVGADHAAPAPAQSVGVQEAADGVVGADAVDDPRLGEEHVRQVEDGRPLGQRALDPGEERGVGVEGLARSRRSAASCPARTGRGRRRSGAAPSATTVTGRTHGRAGRRRRTQSMPKPTVTSAKKPMITEIRFHDRISLIPTPDDDEREAADGRR